MKRKNITIRDDQAEWIRQNHINLSRLVQDAIDKEKLVMKMKRKQ